ncbi:MAG: helix-turn-helix domain-containing protein [Rhodospirillales bacterium]|nr:helix-turn-helix domain-containing protein [Rhodospirillales bacterium]
MCAASSAPGGQAVVNEKPTTVRYKPRRDHKPQDRTDWRRVNALSDEEVEAAALSDPDNPPLSEEQLAALSRLPLAKRVRQALGLSQAEFSARFGIPLRTLQEWEQERRKPDATTVTLLTVIEREPEAVARALAGKAA